MSLSRTSAVVVVPGATQGAGDDNPDESTLAAAEATRLGHFSFEDLLVGMFKELAHKARAGLPVEILENTVTRTDDDLALQELIAASAPNRKAILELDRAHWEAQKKAAQREIEVTPPEREDRKREWRQKEYAAHDRLQEVLAELATVEEVPASASVPDQLQTFGDHLFSTVGNILSCGDRVAQKDRQAFDVIAPNFHLYEANDGTWRASSDVRLPMPDGNLGVFGPVDWPVGNGGRGATVLRAKTSTAGDAPNRDDLIEMMESYPQIERAPLLALINAPFKELPFSVMNGIDGAEFPAWVGPEWRAKPFVDWVTYIYVTTFPSWARRGGYTMVSRERCVAAQFAAQMGRFGEEQLLALLDSPAPRFIDWASRDQVMDGDKNKVWHSAVERVSTPGRVTFYENVRCPNGHKATLVAHVPEVPRDLLCAECLSMPEPERFNMPDGVVFPKAYAEALHFGLDECLTGLRHKWSKKPFKPTGVKVAVLEALKQGPLGAQDIALAVDLPLQRVNAELRDLRWKHKVIKGGGHPAQWRLIGSVPPPAAPRARPRVDQVPEHQVCGPFYGMGDASQVTGFSQTKLSRCREQHRILYVSTGTRWFYPTWQFNEDGKVHAQLAPIIKRLGGADPWAAATWLVSPHSRLNEMSPRDFLLGDGPFDSVDSALEDDRPHLEP